jgi:hypothetical protein
MVKDTNSSQELMQKKKRDTSKKNKTNVVDDTKSTVNQDTKSTESVVVSTNVESKNTNVNKKNNKSVKKQVVKSKLLNIDRQGLNLSTTRVKNYLHNNVLNSKVVHLAFKEFNENKENLLNNEVVLTESHLLSNDVRDLLVNLVNQDVKTRRDKYERSELKNRLSQLSNQEDKNNLLQKYRSLVNLPDEKTKLLKKLDKNFYNNFNQNNPVNSVGEGGWKYYYNKLLRSCKKILSKEAAVYLACFVEEVLRQLINHLCSGSLFNASKSVNLQYMSANNNDFYLRNVVQNLKVWSKANHWVNTEGYKKRNKNEEKVELNVMDVKTGFEVYVDHIYKYVKRELLSGNVNSGNVNSGNVNSGNVNSGNVNSGNVNSDNVNSDNVNSDNVNSGNVNSDNVSGNVNLELLNTMTISKESKAFGVALTVELLDLVGNFLVLETNSRKVRNVNRELMVHVVNLLVTANNLSHKLPELNNTLEMMYNKYMECNTKKVENVVVPQVVSENKSNVKSSNVSKKLT